MSAIAPIKTFSVDALSVSVYADADEVAKAASLRAREILTQAVDSQSAARAVFATGRSQKDCLRLLTSDPQMARVWPQVTGFHLDEYLGIAAVHPASFRNYLAQHLVDSVQMKAFYPIEGDGLEPVSICEAYEKALRSQPLNLGFLGVGNNGHLAFNDPAVTDFEESRWVKLVKLDETNRQQQADSTAFETLNDVPQYAYTLTLSAISAIARLLCLAFGESKAEIISKMLTEPITPACPASMLRLHRHAELLIDEAAASVFLANR